MFELTQATAKLTSFNPRRELHGDDPQPAADLKIEFAMANDDLALFHPTLKSLLYHFDPQIGGDLVDAAKKDEDASYAPHLRFPKLGPLKWDNELFGATVTIHYGLKHGIVLQGCNVNSFVLEPQNGGTVTTSLRVQGHPGEKESGKLCTLIGGEITISVEPPKADEQSDDDIEK